MAADQDDVFRQETPTPGYALLNVGVTYLVARGHATHAIRSRATI